MQDTPAILHIHIGDDTTHEIPADMLCRMLQSVQNLAHLTVAAKTDRGNQKRIFGKTTTIPREYKLICELPQAGSYCIPFRMKNVACPLIDDGLSILRETFLAIATIAGGGNLYDTPLRNLSPDNRGRFYHNLQQLSPSPNDAFKVTIDTDWPGDERLKSIAFTPTLLQCAKATLIQEEERPEQIMTVIGDLISVDFERHLLVIRHYGTHKEIACSYRPEVVDQILQNRDSGVIVTGTFTLDGEGNPKTLSNVSSIQPVDLSPINLDLCEIGSVTLRKRGAEPITIQPFLDEDTKQYFIAERKDLGIEAIAPTREELIQETSQQLVFNWQQYAMEADDILTQSAQALKRSLLKHYALIEETTNA